MSDTTLTDGSPVTPELERSAENKMTEQEMRVAFYKITGHVSANRPAEYSHFRAALKFEREECAKVCDRNAENQARHGDMVAAEQSRQDAVMIRERSNEQK